MRLRGLGLAAGSNTPGPVLIKEARLVGGSRRAPNVLGHSKGKSACLCDYLYVHVWSKAHAYLESMNLMMWVHVSDSICHMDSHTLRTEEERGGDIPYFQCTLEAITVLNCDSTQCDGEYKGCLEEQRSTNHLGRWTEKCYHQPKEQESQITKAVGYCS